MGNKTVLVVDDNLDVLSVLNKRLTVAGYTVFTAVNGKEAVSLAKAKLPNLIILDIILPDVDGGEVARILREDALTKNIPVIFLTCLFTKEDEKESGRIVSGNIFISKPYNIDDLLSEVKKVI